MQTRKWKINLTTIRGPITSVKFLGSNDLKHAEISLLSEEKNKLPHLPPPNTKKVSWCSVYVFFVVVGGCRQFISLLSMLFQFINKMPVRPSVLSTDQSKRSCNSRCAPSHPVMLYDPLPARIFNCTDKRNTRKCSYRPILFKSTDAEIINKI